MDKVSENFKINLNQNLWVLIVGFIGLGLAEYFKLPKLLTLSYFLTIISIISVTVTLLFYTINYCRTKIK